MEPLLSILISILILVVVMRVIGATILFLLPSALIRAIDLVTDIDGIVGTDGTVSAQHIMDIIKIILMQRTISLL
jgi:hypothetical protein